MVIIEAKEELIFAEPGSEFLHCLVRLFYKAKKSNKIKEKLENKGSPVKSAALVFFEEFNRASKGPRIQG